MESLFVNKNKGVSSAQKLRIKVLYVSFLQIWEKIQIGKSTFQRPVLRDLARYLASKNFFPEELFKVDLD